MAIRITQQYVDVLVVGSGSTNLDVSASSTLTLNNTVTTNLVEDSLSTTLALNNTVTTNLLDEALSTTLALNSSATFEGADNVAISSTLSLNNSLSDSFLGGDLSNTLSLNNSIIVDTDNDLTVNASTHIALNNTITASYDEAIGTTIVLNNNVGERTFISSSLSISNSIGVVQNEPPNQSTLALNNTIQVAATEFISLSSSINLSNSILVESSEIDTCRYSPSIGGGNTSYTPPSVTPPAYTQSTLTLTYPAISPTTTLVFKNAAFGNLDTLTYQRIKRDSRGGTLLVFSDPDWPKQEVFQMTFNTLTDTQAESLESFLSLSLGKQIGLLDWEGATHTCIITNNAEFTQTGKNQQSVQLTFEKTL